ncbi:hypothetical protein J7K44_02810 [bacterium]|nr:hypothetical protein [bacterium]
MRKAFFISIFLSVILSIGIVAIIVFGFNAPSSDPPDAKSAISVDSAGNVGIGVETPQAKLDVDGGIYLKADGSNSGELKVKYSSNDPAGYYAVYAP